MQYYHFTCQRMCSRIISLVECLLHVLMLQMYFLVTYIFCSLPCRFYVFTLWS